VSSKKGMRKPKKRETDALKVKKCRKGGGGSKVMGTWGRGYYEEREKRGKKSPLRLSKKHQKATKRGKEEKRWGAGKRGDKAKK